MSVIVKTDMDPFAKITLEAKEDIVEMESKIKAFRSMEMDEDKFKAFRLTRGIYGQRQKGVQMVRIKVSFGRITPEQILSIADVSDEYAAHNLHLTTRQDIQLHYVALENVPILWTKLAAVNVTTREACGNTVRNITASPEAGIDPDEPFDVTPYAYAHFKYLLRNPICQEMGRKFKISFSSSEKDSSFGFMNDIGYIPKEKIENGQKVRGFKVLVGGGLGAQPFLAYKVYDFLPEDQIIPFSESVIRVFDRYGERTKRNRARLKYLIKDIGIEEFMNRVHDERKALKNQSVIIDRNALPEAVPSSNTDYKIEEPNDSKKYKAWFITNVFEQKQKGFYAINIKQFLGDMSTDCAREFVSIVKKYASDDIRITHNQGWLLKFVKKEAIPALFNELDKIGLAEPGFDSTADITACPGTDTCNLGISSSTGIAAELERMIKQEYPDLIFNKNIKIKISGCMNACGQHSIANIGLHGMSVKNGVYVLPAMQLMLGGGFNSDGTGVLADKIVKLPSKRCPDAIRKILDDYEDNSNEGEYFNDYYRRKIAADKTYFYKMLKPLADLTTIQEIDYIDWGHKEKYVTEVGVGECAGVIIDLVAVLINETEEKLQKAINTFEQERYADSIYWGYNTFLSGAKALLMSNNVNCNTQIGIINDFEEHFVKRESLFKEIGSFSEFVLSINKNEPSESFALTYLNHVKIFVNKLKDIRKAQLTEVK